MQNFRRDLAFGQVDEVGAKAAGDCLIKARLIDEAAIDHRLRDRLPVQLHFAEDVFRLRRYEHTLLDEKFGKLFIRHDWRLWVAHASRVLVSASRRNELSKCGSLRREYCAPSRGCASRKVRDGVTPSPTRETRALSNREPPAHISS